MILRRKQRSRRPPPRAAIKKAEKTDVVRRARAVMARWNRRQREYGSWSRRKSRAFKKFNSDLDLADYTPWTITPSLLADRHSSTGWMIVSLAVAAAAVIGFAVWLALFDCGASRGQGLAAVSSH